MHVIDRRGDRFRCEVCHKFRSDVECINPERRKINRRYLCEDCADDVMDRIGEHYAQQVWDGVPKGERWVLFPINPPLLSDDMHDALIVMLNGIDKRIEELRSGTA